MGVHPALVGGLLGMGAAAFANAVRQLPVMHRAPPPPPAPPPSPKKYDFLKYSLVLNH